MTNYHVYPVDDVIEHDTETEDCVCGPEITPIETDEGSFNYLISHHSLDGRELYE